MSSTLWDKNPATCFGQELHPTPFITRWVMQTLSSCSGRLISPALPTCLVKHRASVGHIRATSTATHLKTQVTGLWEHFVQFPSFTGRESWPCPNRFTLLIPLFLWEVYPHTRASVTSDSDDEPQLWDCAFEQGAFFIQKAFSRALGLSWVQQHQDRSNKCYYMSHKCCMCHYEVFPLKTPFTLIWPPKEGHFSVFRQRKHLLLSSTGAETGMGMRIKSD